MEAMVAERDRAEWRVHEMSQELEAMREELGDVVQQVVAAKMELAHTRMTATQPHPAAPVKAVDRAGGTSIAWGGSSAGSSGSPAVGSPRRPSIFKPRQGSYAGDAAELLGTGLGRVRGMAEKTVERTRGELKLALEKTSAAFAGDDKGAVTGSMEDKLGTIAAEPAPSGQGGGGGGPEPGMSAMSIIFKTHGMSEAEWAVAHVALQVSTRTEWPD
jgi:hypothetical protein